MAESPDFRTLSSKENPQLYILNMAKKLRGGRIFLDYLRNGRMATAVRHCVRLAR
jgi:bifunctional non-homologous end joining protein LigD